MTKIFTRRDFMRQSTAFALGAGLGFSRLSKGTTLSSRVVLVRDQNVLDENFKVNAMIVQKMLDDAVKTLFQEKNPIDAYKKIINPDDIVGIKSNVWNYLPTPIQLEKAIERRVLEIGVKPENISIDDRGVRKNPVFVKANTLINVRPLRTHYLAGMSGCMKNYVTFADNIPQYHPNNCINLAALFNLPQVKGKTRLHILCALTPQYHGRGPHHFNRRYVWDYKGLVVGTDPVAVDTVGYKILIGKRKQVFKQSYRLTPNPRYLQIAQSKYKLGIHDWNQIELIKLGYDVDQLV